MKNFGLYWELAKLRILSMVLVTTALGFLLGAHGVDSVLRFCLTLFGVGCATAGAAMLNNYLERDLDARWFEHAAGLCPQDSLSRTAC